MSLDTPEEWLVAIGRSRDRAAFSSLAHWAAPRLKAKLRTGLADEALAEELCQEILLQVWRRAETYDPEKAAASTWLYAVTRNALIDHHRRRGRAEPVEADPAAIPDPVEPADQRLHLARRDARVRDAVARLPPPQREVVEMAFFDARTFAEIATDIGIPTGTAKSRARLAFDRLRSILSWETG